MRLIDADKLIPTTLTDGGYWTKEVFYRKDIDNAPTIDAVEVVRCRDCKHWVEAALRCYHPDRKYSFEKYFLPDCFCSFGERKLDGGRRNET